MKGMEVEKSKNVPENLKKKIARNEKAKSAFLAARKSRHEANKNKKATLIAKAKAYEKEYQDAALADVKASREAKASNGYYVPAESKIALVVRIRGINKHHPDVKKTLRLLRLPQLHNATFVKLNNSTLKMLKRVEPFITFGYPSKKTVSDLVYKRGYGKINGQRIQLQNNKFIEESLGSMGIICTEDLIHEIYTCGENFKKANNFLWPFKLNSPKGGFIAKRKPFHSHGDWGNREEYINQLVANML